MNLHDAANLFLRLAAAEVTPAQAAEFKKAISNASPSDPGLFENAKILERWKNENQTNPSVMILSDRIFTIRQNAESIRNQAVLDKPDYNSIIKDVQSAINGMSVVFGQLGWSRDVPIVYQMGRDADFILRYAQNASQLA